VEYNGVPSDNHCVPLFPATPGVLAVQNQDGTINSSNTPAPSGTTITIWASGFGPFSPPLSDGQVVSTVGALSLPPKITIDGAMASISYAGPAPGLVAGVVQVNVALPGTTGTIGRQVNLTIEVEKQQTATRLWVK